MSGFADRIFGYFAILEQMSGFADRIFGYFEILLQQVQVPGTGTVYCSTGTQILVLVLVPRYRTQYLDSLSLLQDILGYFALLQHHSDKK